MPNLTKEQILNEPPGKRRAYLALRHADKTQHDIAAACNSHHSSVSRAVADLNADSELSERLRTEIAKQTRFSYSWLFEHRMPATSHSRTPEHNGLAA